MVLANVKVDDFGGGQPEKWNVFFDMCDELYLPISIGVIGQRLTDTPASTLTRLRSADCEIFNHGWLHSVTTDGVTEFCVSDVSYQIEMIGRCQRACKEILALMPTGFGPPFNLYNRQTIEALADFGEFSYIYDIVYIPNRATLPKSWRIECEGPDTNREFSFDRAWNAARGFILRRLPFVLQIHPGNHWTGSSVDKFRQFIQAARASGVRFAKAGRVAEWRP